MSAPHCVNTLTVSVSAPTILPLQQPLPSQSGLQRVTELQLESLTEQELALDVLWDRRAGTQRFSCCLGLTDQASLSLLSKAGHADPSQGSGNGWLHGSVGFPYREDL